MRTVEMKQTMLVWAAWLISQVVAIIVLNCAYYFGIMGIVYTNALYNLWLELSTMLAGTVSALLFAHWGAQVLKERR